MSVLTALPLHRLVDELGTPVLVLSHHLLTLAGAAFARAAQVLPPHRIFYSVKTNDEKHLLRFMAPRVDGFDVLCGDEIELALQNRHARHQRMVLNGPNKSEADIERALRSGFALVQLDGYDDARRVAAVVRRCGAPLDVGVRLAFRAASVWEKFGVDPDGDEMRGVLDVVASEPRLRLCALHHHGDMHLDDSASVVPLLTRLDRVRADLRACGFPIEVHNLGGGWDPAVSIGEGGALVDDDRCARAFRDIAAHYRHGSAPLLYLEPGRALVEGGMVAVARVGNVKVDRGHRFVFVDLSSGWVGGRHPCDRRVKFLLDGEAASELRPATIAGPVCSGSDLLGDALLPQALGGRLLVMANCGAYTLTLRWHGPAVRPTLVWVDAHGSWLRSDVPAR